MGILPHVLRIEDDVPYPPTFGAGFLWVTLECFLSRGACAEESAATLLLRSLNDHNSGVLTLLAAHGALLQVPYDYRRGFGNDPGILGVISKAHPGIQGMKGNSADRILDSRVVPVTPDPSPVEVSTSSAGHATARALDIIQEWGQIYSLTATSCAICGLPLRDAVSVARGIGPDCSRQHYELDFVITDLMVKSALGVLFASGLEAPVKLAAKGLKDRPRELCNVLLWWCSAHLDNRDTVLDCAAIVTALGFVSLGDRLRERNTDVVITLDPSGDYVLRCKSKYSVRRNMQRVKEASSVPRQGRFTYGWRFPANRKHLVWTILGDAFGDQWATVPDGAGRSKVVRIPVAFYWEISKAFDAAYPPVVQPALPLSNLGIVRKAGDNLEVHTPKWDPDFLVALKELPYKDRRWNSGNKCWEVDPKHETRVRELVLRYFQTT